VGTLFVPISEEVEVMLHGESFNNSLFVPAADETIYRRASL
jgi:hypothetical protein